MVSYQAVNNAPELRPLTYRKSIQTFNISNNYLMIFFLNTVLDIEFHSKPFLGKVWDKVFYTFRSKILVSIEYF